MNKPIGVYTLWRSGSTAYCQHLSNKLDLVNFDEMFFNTSSEYTRPLLDNFVPTKQQLINLTKNTYVFKVMPDQLQPEIIDNIDWQVLERRDLESQILSYSYAHYTNKWFSKSNEVVTLPLDFARYFVKHLNIYRKVKDQYSWPVTYYEDLKLNKANLQPSNNDYRKLVKNYIEIINLL